jgi:hypothetical protein
VPITGSRETPATGGTFPRRHTNWALSLSKSGHSYLSVITPGERGISEARRPTQVTRALGHASRAHLRGRREYVARPRSTRRAWTAALEAALLEPAPPAWRWPVPRWETAVELAEALDVEPGELDWFAGQA